MIDIPLETQNNDNAPVDGADINSEGREEQGCGDEEEKRLFSASTECDIRLLDATSFQGTDVGSERGRAAPGPSSSAPVSPSPPPSAALSASRNTSTQSSSPQLMATRGQLDMMGNAHSLASAAGPHSRAKRAPRGSLMPPPPSPSTSRSEWVCVAQQQSSLTEGQDRDLQQTLYENEELRRELGRTRTSLQQALRMVEVREMECLELNQLVDHMQAQCQKVEQLELDKSCPSGEVDQTTISSHHAVSPVAGTVVDVANAAHCNVTAEVMQPQLNATNTSTATTTCTGDNNVVPQQLHEEYDRLAKELARVKVIVAEQNAVLDRLGLQYPYTTEMIGAARVVILKIKPLKQKQSQQH